MLNDEANLLLTISLDEDDPYTVIVSGLDGIVERIYVGPRPTLASEQGVDRTFPTPAEANDLVADGVRKVLDQAWANASGEPVQR